MSICFCRQKIAVTHEPHNTGFDAVAVSGAVFGAKAGNSSGFSNKHVTQAVLWCPVSLAHSLMYLCITLFTAAACSCSDQWSHAEAQPFRDVIT